MTASNFFFLSPRPGLLNDRSQHMVGRISETTFDGAANINIPTVPYELPVNHQKQTATDHAN